MSASLGRLDESLILGAGRTSTSPSEQSDVGAVRPKKGQKRHSISGLSSLGFPHQTTNPNHAIQKTSGLVNKKRARFEASSQATGFPSSLAYTFPHAGPRGAAPISIPSAQLSVPQAVVSLPCSKCAVLLPLQSSSVPLSQEPLCIRCQEGPDSQQSSFPIFSASVPSRPHARHMTDSHVPYSVNTFSSYHPHQQETPLGSDDEDDFEFVHRPATPVDLARTPSRSRKQHAQAGQHVGGGGEWSLEEEFAFLDTVDDIAMDDMDEDVAPPVATLPGWGGPFFRSCSDILSQKYSHNNSTISSTAESRSQSPLPPISSHHRAATSPASSMSSSTSSLSSPSGLPSPLGYNLPSGGLYASNPSIHPTNYKSNDSTSALGLARSIPTPPPSVHQPQPTRAPLHLDLNNPQAFLAEAQARLLHRPSFDNMLSNAPMSPIFGQSGGFSSAMKKTQSGQGNAGGMPSALAWESKMEA
jgi:hypothetical protein